MRILGVSDIHFDLRWMEWISVMATTLDATLIAGDILDARGSPPRLSKRATPEAGSKT